MTSIVLELPEDKVGRAFPDGINMKVTTIPRRGDKMLVSVEDQVPRVKTLYVVAEITHEVRAGVSSGRGYDGVVIVRLAVPGDT